MKNSKRILVILYCKETKEDKITQLAGKIDKIFRVNQKNKDDQESAPNIFSNYIQPVILSFSRVNQVAHIVANTLGTVFFGNNIPWEKDRISWKKDLGDFENYIERAKVISERFSYVVIVVDNDIYPSQILSELGWGNVVAATNGDAEVLRSLKEGQFVVFYGRENTITHYSPEKADKRFVTP